MQSHYTNQIREPGKGTGIKCFEKSLMGICHHYVYMVLRMFIDHFQIMMTNSEIKCLPAINHSRIINKQKSIHPKASNRQKPDAFLTG